jgi:hypothetical protein
MRPGKHVRIAAVLGLLLVWMAAIATVPAHASSPSSPRFQHPLRSAAVAAASSGVGYIPCDVARAYGLGTQGLTGTGVTIAVIVASDEPNLQSDLRGFDKAFGLPDANVAVSAPFGHTPQVDPGWPAEIALDVEWAHAAAPGAVIDVVEAATDQFQNPPQADPLATTLWAVQNLNPDVVVMPWGGAESTFAQFYGSTFEAQFNTQFFPPTNAAGGPVSYLASAGGNGFEADWPAVATTVVGVGGTSLAPQAFGYSSFPNPHTDCSQAGTTFGVNGTNETVWGSAGCAAVPCAGTGGGASALEAKPSWQAGSGPGSNRLEPDVAAMADPGVATFINGQLDPNLLSGTGLATALWGGVLASLDQERQIVAKPGLSVSSSASWLYSASAADFNDVIHGSSPGVPNDPCLTSGACGAQPGYDEVSGRGSPLMANLVPDAAGSVPAPPSQPSPTPTAPAAPHIASVTSGAVNRLDIFARGLDNGAFHRWWDGGAWQGWEARGGALAGQPSVIARGANLDVFYRGTDNALWHLAWDGSQWLPAESLGGLLNGDPTAVSWGANRLDVVMPGADGAVWHRWWNGTTWGGWESLGIVHDLVAGAAGQSQEFPEGFAGRVVATTWGAGRLDVFATDQIGFLWHRAFDGTRWAAWGELAGPSAGKGSLSVTSDPSAVSWGPGRVDVFVRLSDNAMWHDAFSGGWWLGLESLGGGLSSEPTAESWGANRIDVFARGTDNGLWHMAWSGQFSAWQSLGGGLASDPIAVSWGANRIDAFARGTDNGLWHMAWDGAQWVGWQPLGGSLT